MKKTLFLLSSMAVAWFFLWESEVRLGPGVFAPDPPEQIKTEPPTSFPFKEYTLTPLATFEIKAKILSRKNYLWGRESDISPVDFALGWGKMSDEEVLDHIDISQSYRWYRWWTETFPIPHREIETHSANMHLIPANKTVKSAINQARRGDIVELSGSLVRADADDGWFWTSSLSRTDTGAHSCELIWVENFEILEL